MKQQPTFSGMDLENTTGSTAGKRMERAYWLLCGIEMLAHDTATENIKPPYNAEETAEIIRELAWLAAAELAPVMEAAADTKTA